MYNVSVLNRLKSVVITEEVIAAIGQPQILFVPVTDEVEDTRRSMMASLPDGAIPHA